MGRASAVTALLSKKQRRNGCEDTLSDKKYNFTATAVKHADVGSTAVRHADVGSTAVQSAVTAPLTFTTAVTRVRRLTCLRHVVEARLRCELLREQRRDGGGTAVTALIPRRCHVAAREQ